MWKKTLVALLSAVSLLSLLFFTLLPSNIFVVYASGTPDSYGDRINWIYIEQYIDASWVFKGNVTTSNYTTGVQVNVQSLTTTRFNCSVHLNDTYASSNNEAMANTRVYFNVTYTNGTVVISTTEMTDFTVNGLWNVESYYLWDNPSTYPESGVTYYVYFKYEAYY